MLGGLADSRGFGVFIDTIVWSSDIVIVHGNLSNPLGGRFVLRDGKTERREHEDWWVVVLVLNCTREVYVGGSGVGWPQSWASIKR